MKQIKRMVAAANEIAAELPQDTPYLTGILAGLAMTEDHADQLLAETAIKCGDKEPLDDSEEIVWDKLESLLDLPENMFACLTHEQKFSAARVIRKHGNAGRIKHGIIGASWGDYLGINFDHIFVGIEKDGYAHS